MKLLSHVRVLILKIRVEKKEKSTLQQRNSERKDIKKQGCTTYSEAVSVVRKLWFGEWLIVKERRGINQTVRKRLESRTSLLPFFLPPMANNNSSSISNPHEPSKPFTCITLSSVTKLLRSTYLTWKLQVEALLDGYDLLKYPDRSFPAPPMTISTIGVPPTLNLAYHTWLRQDRLIYDALLTTLFPEVESLVSQTTTSHDLWTLVQCTYAKASRSHLKQLKERLHTTSKGTQSITTYMHSLKQTADLLASLGSPVSVEDMTDHVLQAMVIEMSLTASMQGTLPFFLMTSSRSFSFKNSPLLMLNDSNHKLFLGRCQWCNVKSHVLSQCHTFKQQHPGVPMPPRSSSANPRQVQVHTTTAGTSQNNFLVDSRAMHHVTNDLDNLALHHPYMGPNSLFMGNGSGLNITHSGTLLLNDLSLSHTLCVPSMQQKILSVSQLTKQTIFVVVFLPNSFYVKNLQTGQITHNGSCVDGLYLWPANSSSVHPVCIDSSASWHHRLGHPSSSIFTFIQQHFSLGSNKFQQSDCNSCQINKSHKLPFNESTLKSSYPLEIIFSDVTRRINMHTYVSIQPQEGSTPFAMSSSLNLNSCIVP
ncbi:hypothetical protein V8G54_011382 [Vigna mungo]|uniref:GAG-pre-integrase domain-containing protein n=1 Tax=Vigna mungo TaxID=3915 RepID=A0AAQ3S2V5_VIGMU